MKKYVYLLLFVLAVAAAFVGGTKFSSRAHSAAASRHILYYVDPMHPAYKSDKPGTAPDCGMDLVPVYADEVQVPTQAATSVPGTINITPEKQQLIGVRVAKVENASSSATLRLYGRVVPEENRVFPLNAGTEGFVRELSRVTTGATVKKGEWLATIYSQDSRVPVQLFLSTLDVIDAAKRRGADAEVGPAQESAQFAERRLLGLGMAQAQIDEIRRTRRSPLDLKIDAPADGFVIARNIALNQKYDKGMEFYRIANLDKVWIVADVAAADAVSVKPGTSAKVWLAGRYKALQATVSELLPQVDPATRTLKIRLEAANPGYVLRPEMFVDVELTTAAMQGLIVAAESVLDSGDTKTVFVEKSEGVFEPRRVETGARVGENIQIVSGLQGGERIVVSGNFLVGSEARLRGVVAAPQNVATQKVAMGSRKVKDPSCGMEIDAAEAEAAGHTTEYKQTTYHFCSEGCKRKFMASPEKYGGHTMEHRQVAANNVAQVTPGSAARHDR
jgi:Cu(I)/Ag(I) efflux system membrane fusion protein